MRLTGDLLADRVGDHAGGTDPVEHSIWAVPAYVAL